MSRNLTDFLRNVGTFATSHTGTSTTKICHEIQGASAECNGILVIDLDVENPSISMCSSGKAPQNRCAFWKVLLNYEIIESQMVDSAGLMMDGDDVNMENTLLSFAGYFASSLLTEKKISFTLPHGTNSHLQLHLQYDMGTYEAPATLKIPLIQDDLHNDIYDIIRKLSGFKTSPLSSSCHSSVAVREANATGPSQNDFTSISLGDISPPRKRTTVEDIVSVSEAVGRKKAKGSFTNVSRGGGVSLFPSRRSAR